MTESEVLKIFENEVIILDCWIEHCKDIIADCETEEDEFDDDKERAELSLRDYTERKEAFDVAISALKEIQQYREIGTVEECKELAYIVNIAEKEELAKIIDEYLLYSKIGTVEECREAVEKQKPKNPVKDKYHHNCCPNCGKNYEVDYDDYKHCPECGQRLDIGG